MATLYQGVWANWTVSSTSTSTANTVAWSNWTTTGTNGATLAANSSAYQLEVVETPERWAAQEEAARVRAAEQRATAARIRERGEQTLALLLTPEQLEDWRRTSSFRLITQAGHEYKIKRGISGNVKLIEQGEEVESLCCHPSGVSREDVVIAQVLALRTDEEGFRRTANISRIRDRFEQAA